MAGMALHPVPDDFVTARGQVERLPELTVLYRLLLAGLPAVPLPAMDPFGDAVHDVFAVGIEVDSAGLLQRIERGDGGKQFHAVVGCLGLAARQFLGHAAVAQHCAPAAGPGIAGAGTVGEDLDLLGHVSPYSDGDLIARWKRMRRIYSVGSRFITMPPSGTVSQS